MHGCQDSGKPGNPGNIREKIYGQGKPGKPGKVREFFFPNPKKFFCLILQFGCFSGGFLFCIGE